MALLEQKLGTVGTKYVQRVAAGEAALRAGSGTRPTAGTRVCATRPASCAARAATTHSTRR